MQVNDIKQKEENVEENSAIPLIQNEDVVKKISSLKSQIKQNSLQKSKELQINEKDSNNFFITPINNKSVDCHKLRLVSLSFDGDVRENISLPFGPLTNLFKSMKPTEPDKVENIKSNCILPKIKLERKVLATESVSHKKYLSCNTNNTQKESEDYNPTYDEITSFSSKYSYNPYNYVPGVLHIKEADLQERAFKICERFAIEFKNLSKLKNVQWLWKYYPLAMNKLLNNLEDLEHFTLSEENRNKNYPLCIDDMNEMQLADFFSVSEETKERSFVEIFYLIFKNNEDKIAIKNSLLLVVLTSNLDLAKKIKLFSLIFADSSDLGYVNVKKFKECLSEYFFFIGSLPGSLINYFKTKLNTDTNPDILNKNAFNIKCSSDHDFRNNLKLFYSKFANVDGIISSIFNEKMLHTYTEVTKIRSVRLNQEFFLMGPDAKFQSLPDCENYYLEEGDIKEEKERKKAQKMKIFLRKIEEDKKNKLRVKALFEKRNQKKKEEMAVKEAEYYKKKGEEDEKWALRKRDILLGNLRRENFRKQFMLNDLQILKPLNTNK